MRVRVVPGHGVQHGGGGGVVQEMMPNLGHRRLVAQADAGGAHDARSRAQPVREFQRAQLGIQRLGAEHGAGHAVAHADDQGRQARLTLFGDIEMRVEGRRLEHLGKGEAQLVGQRRQVCGGDLMPFVLDEMQVLDQVLPIPRPVAEQYADLVLGLRHHLPALGGGFRAPAPGARMLEPQNLSRCRSGHGIPFRSLCTSRALVYDEVPCFAICCVGLTSESPPLGLPPMSLEGIAS